MTIPPSDYRSRLEASDQAAIALGKSVRYHILAGKSFSVECENGERAIVGAGWLAIREEEYTHLRTEIHRLSSALAVAEKALGEIGEAKHGVVDWQITGHRTVTCEEHAAAALATLNPTKEEIGG